MHLTVNCLKQTSKHMLGRIKKRKGGNSFAGRGGPWIIRRIVDPPEDSNRSSTMEWSRMKLLRRYRPQRAVQALQASECSELLFNLASVGSGCGRALRLESSYQKAIRRRWRPSWRCAARPDRACPKPRSAAPKPRAACGWPGASGKSTDASSAANARALEVARLAA